MANNPRPELPPNLDASPRCRNCGAIASAHFCPECGQPVKDRNRSIWSLGREFISNVLATDARAWRTLVLLVFRPGVLTQENLRGRWQSYVPPFRLYLFLSLLSLFALLGPFSEINVITAEFSETATTPKNQEAETLPSESNQEAEAVPEDSNQEAEAAPGESVQEPEAVTGESAEDGAKLDAEAEAQPKPEAQANPEEDTGFFAQMEAYIEQQNERFRSMTPEEQVSTFLDEAVAAFPTFLILVIPLFAIGLKILFLGSGRFLFEHLLFSCHFSSLALTIFAIGSLLPWQSISYGLYFGYLPLYLMLAIRRVYGSSWIGVILRMPFILAIAFFISLFLTITVAFYAFLQA